MRELEVHPSMVGNATFVELCARMGFQPVPAKPVEIVEPPKAAPIDWDKPLKTVNGGKVKMFRLVEAAETSHKMGARYRLQMLPPPKHSPYQALWDYRPDGTCADVSKNADKMPNVRNKE